MDISVLQGQNVEKLAALARSYTPEWRFDPKDPDAGTALALLIEDMRRESEKRLAQVLHKHHIQYLNLFDHLKEEPIESAKSYVRFRPASGAGVNAYVPKGTGLFADDPKSGQRLSFETNYGIATTEAELQNVVATDGGSDRIVRLMDTLHSVGDEGFRVFDLSGVNEAEHALLLAYDGILDHLENFTLTLTVSANNDEEALEAAQMLAKPAVQFAMEEPEDAKNPASAHPFDKVEQQENRILLTMEDYPPKKVQFQGKEQYVLRISSNDLGNLQLSTITLSFSEGGILPDEVAVQNVTQNIGRFLPFGSPMEIYAECAVESKSVFARPGAQVQMTFDLSFQVEEQTLPETQENLDLKIIMKKPVEAPKLETVEIHPDGILIEYYSKTRGWRRLLSDEDAAALFSGTKTGMLAVDFTCPTDMAAEGVVPYRMRIRLMRADNLYRVPSRQYCPVITDLRFSYSYDQAPLLPNGAESRNNFLHTDVLPMMRVGRCFPLFFNQEARGRTMYFGFDKNPCGMPVSLYFEVDNDSDIPVGFVVEYLGVDGFQPLQAVDNTGGFLYSGTVLIPVPEDAVKTEKFGRDGYWLRFLQREEPKDEELLPLVRFIVPNMVRVENRRTQEQLGFTTDAEADLNITLEEKNIISAKVYVNEEDGIPGQDNWVLWNKRTSLNQTGRFYLIDLAAGRVYFPRKAFAPYPLKEGRAAVKVEYQSYQGSTANVEADKIIGLSKSLRYISGVTNPMAAYGGYDGYNEKTGASIIANMLRTRGRAVTQQDYFDIISQVSYGVRKIKCISGVDRRGKDAPDTVTVALLIDEYKKGSHIFSAVKDTIRDKLLSATDIVPMGRTLVLTQPHFLRFSARIWVECGEEDNAYDLQQQTKEDVETFLDPLIGGFDGKGWEIGTLPTVKQLLAYLKMRRPNLNVARMAMSAQGRTREYAVDDDIMAAVDNPFAMAINGAHTVYVRLGGKQ